MRLERLSRIFEIASSAAVVVVCAFAVVGFAMQRIDSAPKSVAIKPGLRRGEPLPSPAAADLAGPGKTLVFVLSPGCEHCVESVPTIRSIVDPKTLEGGMVRCVALFAEPESEARAFLEREQLPMEAR